MHMSTSTLPTHTDSAFNSSFFFQFVHQCFLLFRHHEVFFTIDCDIFSSYSTHSIRFFLLALLPQLHLLQLLKKGWIPRNRYSNVHIVSIACKIVSPTNLYLSPPWRYTHRRSNSYRLRVTAFHRCRSRLQRIDPRRATTQNSSDRSAQWKG